MKFSDRKMKWAGAVIVALVVLVVFAPVLQGEFLSWDDQELFLENPYYRGLSPSHWRWMCSTFLLGHWQPLSWLSYALDYKVWGLNPLGWHATNLLLHTVNAVLVYLLCLAFLKKQNRRYGAAALAALFWAVHPLRVETTAWLATRGYLLCTAFCLLTVLFYLRAVQERRYPLAALLFFTLATFTKGIGMMLPPVLLLMDWFPLRRITSVRTAAACVVEKTPFFALSMLTGITAFLAKKYNGGMAPVEHYGFAERFGQAVYGVWFYLLKTVSPVNLLPLYDKRPEAGPVMIALVLTATVSIFLFLFRRKLRPVTVALGAFLLLIFPMVGFTQSGMQFFADRFTYLAAVSFTILLASGLNRLMKIYQAVWGALAVLLMIFSAQTFMFSITWSDGLLMWSYLVERDGQNAQAYNGMGRAFMSRNCYTKALKCFDKALLLDPSDTTALQNRALVLVEEGRYNEALSDASQALSLENFDKVVRAKILIGRGQIFEKLGKSEQALADYSAVLADHDTDPFWKVLALQSRARLYLELGRRTEAKADMEVILELQVSAHETQKVIRLLDELKKIPEE